MGLQNSSTEYLCFKDILAPLFVWYGHVWVMAGNGTSIGLYGNAWHWYWLRYGRAIYPVSIWDHGHWFDQQLVLGMQVIGYKDGTDGTGDRIKGNGLLFYTYIQ